MDFVDLIEKKKQGKAHTKEEISYIISSLLSGELLDSQIASWLMAINFKSLTEDEMLYLSESLISSGKVIDFSELQSKAFYLNSTFGIGDKLNLILVFLLSVLDVPVLLLSEKCGYQCAVDKFESIPGFKTALSDLAIVNQIKNIGSVVSFLDDELIGVTNRLSNIEYNTATANSDVLISVSIILKIIVSGVSNAVIDLKFGNGALIKTCDEAVHISSIIVNLSKMLKKDVVIVITSTEEPLGRAVGNSMEIIETMEFLKGNIISGDLPSLVYYIGALILYKTGICNSISEGIENIRSAISTGKAIDKFRELVVSQGGDAGIIGDYDKFNLPCYKVECESKKNGYVQNIDGSCIYQAAKQLGAFRDNLSNKVDYTVGIYLNKKSGEQVKKGDVLYTIYSNEYDKTKKAQALCDMAFIIGDTKPSDKSLVHKVIGIEEEDV